MNGASTRPLSGLVGLILLVVMLAAQWLYLDRLERAQEDTFRASREAELRHLLPVLRGRADPVFLAEEFLHASLGLLASGTTAAFRRFERELARTYGNEVAVALWDGKGEGRLVLQRLFSPAEVDVLFKALCHQYHRETNDWKYAEDFSQRLQTMAGNTSFLGAPYAHINFVEVTLNGRRGALFIALVAVPPRRMNQSTREILSRQRPLAPNTHPEVRARVAVFIPQRRLYSPRSMVRALRSRPLARSLPLLVGPARQPARWLPAPVPVQVALARAWRSQDQGSLVIGETGFAFTRLTEIPDWIMVHPRAFPRPGRLARAPWFLALTALWLTAMVALGVVRGSRPDWWGAAITHKFLTLVILAALLPTLGLVWITWTRAGLEADLRELTLFRECEEELEGLEQSLNQRVQEAIAAAKRFLRRREWSEPTLPPRAAIASNVLELGSQGAGTLYLVARGNPEVMAFSGEVFPGSGQPRPERAYPRTVDDDEKIAGSPSAPGMQVALLVPALLRKLSEHFGIAIDTSGLPSHGLRMEEIRGGVLLDVLEVVLGKDALLRMVVQPGRLQPFRMLHEVTWALLEIIRDPDRRARLLFLFIFQRKEIQYHTFFTRIFERGWHLGGFPRMILMNTLLTRNNTLFPEWTDVFPVATTLLRQAFREQGVQRLVLPRPGSSPRELGNTRSGRILAIARPLRGTDFVAVAIRRQPEDEKADPIVGVSILARLYPVAIALLAVFLFQRIFLRPVHALQAGVEAIAGGRYDVRLPVVTDDEIGQLCASFNRMAKGVREKEFLRRFLSHLAMEAVEGGQIARAIRVTGTVVMSDIRGFTTISEERPPEEVVEMLNAYLTAMEVAIEKNAGTIEKFIGDAIFAVFLPVHGRDAPERRAAQAGLDMLKALGRFNRDRQRRGRFTIACGVGIASGELLMGMVGGADGRREFTVTGPTVSQAAAMEKLTKQTHHTKLVVCPLTAARLGEGWTTVPLPTPPGRPPEAFEIGFGSST